MRASSMPRTPPSSARASSTIHCSASQQSSTHAGNGSSGASRSIHRVVRYKDDIQEIQVLTIHCDHDASRSNTQVCALVQLRSFGTENPSTPICNVHEQVSSQLGERNIRICKKQGSLPPFSDGRAPGGQNTRRLTLLSPRVYFRGMSKSSCRATGRGSDCPFIYETPSAL
jgi:hypothetical protein